MKEIRFPRSEELMGLVRNLGPAEKIIFTILCAIFIFTGLGMAYKVNALFLVDVPANGGEIHEGVIGVPRFINPVLAQSDVDRDLTSVIYGGLLKQINGQFIPELAESYTISEDGLVYNFIIKKDAQFHDGVSLTTDDIAYTIEKIQDPLVKSPKRAAWKDVTVKIISSHELSFELKQPYAPFIEQTTLGILPKHLWRDIESDNFVFSKLNSEPIGAGAYKIDTIKHDSRGLPSIYTLSVFKKYVGKKPYIETLSFSFFPNEKILLEAFSENIIDSVAGISPEQAVEISKTYTDKEIINTALPRIFAAFFNQSQQQLFAEKYIRQALYLAVDTNKIVEDVIKGYGKTIDLPLPIEKNHEYNLEAATKLLTDNKWIKNSNGIFEKRDKTATTTLSFSISTSNTPELRMTANMLKDFWQKLGADVELKLYESGDLNQNIIRPRKYDILLFGETVAKEADLYAYWHSSQRNDPGVNVALYANSKVDKLLEEIRVTRDDVLRSQKASDAANQIKLDIPGIFLYMPNFIYIIPDKLNTSEITHISLPSERFSTISDWYIKTDKVWKFLEKRLLTNN